MTLDDHLRQLIRELREVSRAHREIGDTEVRDEFTYALYDHFVLGRAGSGGFPTRFQMLSPEGDAAVADALRRFLTAVEPDAAGLAPGEQRRRAFDESPVWSHEDDPAWVGMNDDDSLLPPIAAMADCVPEWSPPPDELADTWRSAQVAACRGSLPGACPRCGADLRFFFVRHEERAGARGGFWLWCPGCRLYDHESGRVPDWWIDVRVEASALTHVPEWLEANWQKDWLAKQPLGRL